MFGPMLFLCIAGISVVLFTILPIVLGIAALRRIDKAPGQYSGRGLAIGAIVLGVLGLIMSPLILLAMTFTARSASASSVRIATPAGSISVLPSGVQLQRRSGRILSAGTGGQGGVSITVNAGQNGQAGQDGEIVEDPDVTAELDTATKQMDQSMKEMDATMKHADETITKAGQAINAAGNNLTPTAPTAPTAPSAPTAPAVGQPAQPAKKDDF